MSVLHACYMCGEQIDSNIGVGVEACVNDRELFCHLTPHFYGALPLGETQKSMMNLTNITSQLY